MRFKPVKSRSLVLREGKVMDRFRFSIEGAPIQTVSEKPEDILCKIFNSSLKDTTSVQATGQELERWLREVERWTGRDLVANAKPGSTNMASCGGYSGRC
ncbi:hypothetical protein KUCAC02_030485 [Chaenocephalus aceratus]|uniref:Uncharacterized protein n=1 Tax=Chaenocephalus aceratus TaxID=36190 RepID=A0ACB9XK87_CHAAC|nr:hypothetical protein KUCAC02_030485 [Chaenocephalus aceratus]